MSSIELGPDEQNIALYKDELSSVDVRIDLNDEIFDFNTTSISPAQVIAGRGVVQSAPIASAGLIILDVEDVITENNLNLEGELPSPPPLDQGPAEFLPALNRILAIGSIRSQNIADTVLLSRTAKTIVSTLTNNYSNSTAGSGSLTRLIR